MRSIISVTLWVAVAISSSSLSSRDIALDAFAAGSRDVRKRGAQDNGDTSPTPPIRKGSKVESQSDASDEIESLERQCLNEINRLRRAYHLAPLQMSSKLRAVARIYSRRMAEEGFFSHVDPQGRSTRMRVDDAGISWRSLAENIASNRGFVNPVATSMTGWMGSEGHRRNILSAAFDQTAVGVWIDEEGRVYFTEIFLQR